MAAATVLSSVSTAAVATEDRLAFWEHYNSEALVGLACRTYADEGLVARQLNLDLGGFRVADIAGNAHVIERAPPLVRTRPKDAVFVSLMLEGQAFFYHPGGCSSLDPGDLVVYDTEQPYLFGFSTSMRQVLVDVPRALFIERCGPLVGGPLTVGGNGPGAAAVASRSLQVMLRGLVDDPVVVPDTVRDQLLAVLETMTTGRGAPEGIARLLDAKEHIIARLQDDTLSTDQVAAAVGITSRHLNRAFADEGTTVAQFIRSRRLDGAVADLSDPAVRDHRIADIAARWGFSSQAHFARLVRDHFGCTPSDLRNGTATPPPGGRRRS